MKAHRTIEAVVPMEKDEPVEKQATALRRTLLAWFRRKKRDYPWRRTRDVYRIWLSEIMLQQTRIEAVRPYYERFLKAFPTVADLAAAHEDRVLKLWEGLGYYGRARNLHQAARLIAGERGGRFPGSADEWRRLPGIGRYTAGAIASIAFGERVPVVDGNVKRVLARLFAIDDCIDEAHAVERLWSIADKLVSPRSPGNFNQALMELGGRICLPRRPRCGRCPVAQWCEARASGRQEDLPVRRAKKPVPHFEIVAAAIRKRGRYLLGKRPTDGILGGLWEFPGGKVRKGETRKRALVREVKEELGIRIGVGALVASVDHAYSHFTITLHVYRCEHVAGRPCADYHTEVKWVPQSQFDLYAFPAANRKVMDRL